MRPKPTKGNARRSGKATYQNGGCYEGDFRRDHRWGWGKHIFPDGSIYEGEWYDDLIEGVHVHVRLPIAHRFAISMRCLARGCLILMDGNAC